MLQESLSLARYKLLIIILVLMVTILPSGLQIVAEGVASTTLSQIALPGCPEKCGETQIPYPFGIGENCHYNHHPFDNIIYGVSCNDSTDPPSLVYGENIQVANITLDGEFRVINHVAYDCYNTKGYVDGRTASISIPMFPVSTTLNTLLAFGCDSYVWFSSVVVANITPTLFQSGCMTMCNREQLEVVGYNTCSGIGCCQASIPNGVTNISIEANSINNHSLVVDFNPCSIAFVVANDVRLDSLDQLLNQNETSLSNLRFPMVFNWVLGTKGCEAAKLDGEYICKGNSTCLDDLPDVWGYRCQCKPGFQGNPYLHDCQDIDECMEGKHACEKPAYCVNSIGSYICSCPRGYNSHNNTSCIRVVRSKTIQMILGVGGGVIVSLLIAFWFYWKHARRQLTKLREECFRQNGGHILLTKLSGRDVSVGSMVKMFTVEEIKKATNDYSVNSIIGRGGFGMVYKGLLANNQVVAIKKSVKADFDQVEQFINEVIALSHVNHKNVVKLLGCCLETKVPLLVYEYIRNGTLRDHLHDEQKARFLTWDVRLRIATEVAEVLAYLHTMISIPIIHMDIKSMNILLDEKYIAKVADFGAAKLVVPTNQDQLATMIQGTYGYLDPEYLQTGVLTEKSDVYSFGVVLAELLTKEKALSYDKPEDEKCLAIYFIRKLKENRLFEILDDNIVSAKATQQLKEVANVARKCLKVRGEDRPTMKQVARELEDITAMGSHPWSNNNGGILRHDQESEYLLGETTQLNNNGYGNEATNDLLNSHSNLVQLVPLGDGR